MSLIVFSKTGLSNLTLEHGRTIPHVPENIDVNQEISLTEDNVAKVIDYGPDLTLIRLEFNHLSKDNYDGTVNGLKTWFESSTINWCANSFNMTDENGINRSVRLWQIKFSMARDHGGRYSVSFILKEE